MTKSKGSDINSTEGVEVNGSTRKKRSPNKAKLMGLTNVRANLSSEAYKLLVNKEAQSRQSRDLIIESALRVFMSASAEVRKEALLTSKSARVTGETDNI